MYCVLMFCFMNSAHSENAVGLFLFYHGCLHFDVLLFEKILVILSRKNPGTCRYRSPQPCSLQYQSAAIENKVGVPWYQRPDLTIFQLFKEVTYMEESRLSYSEKSMIGEFVLLSHPRWRLLHPLSNMVWKNGGNKWKRKTCKQARSRDQLINCMGYPGTSQLSTIHQ
jgi:hypothetical protein